jgi:hypothetical protein
VALGLRYPVYPSAGGPHETTPYHAAILARPDAKRVYIRLLESDRTNLGGQLEALLGLGYVDVPAMRARAVPYLSRRDSVTAWGGDVGWPESVGTVAARIVRWHTVERHR